MRDVLLALVLMAGAFAAAVAGSAAWALNRVQRRNRVSPSLRVDAPSWLASPSRCAGLHRRLRGAVAVVQHAVPPVPAKRLGRRRPEPTQLQRLAADVEAHAVRLDRSLALAARLPSGPRRRHLAELEPQVAELESLAARIAAGATAHDPARLSSEPSAAGLAAVAAELDALEAAHDELARLERAVGLEPATTPPAVGAPGAQALPTPSR